MRKSIEIHFAVLPGKHAELLDQADGMSKKQIAEMKDKAKKRVAETYLWEKIRGRYEEVFMKAAKGDRKC